MTRPIIETCKYDGDKLTVTGNLNINHIILNKIASSAKTELVIQNTIMMTPHQKLFTSTEFSVTGVSNGRYQILAYDTNNRRDKVIFDTNLASMHRSLTHTYHRYGLLQVIKNILRSIITF
jgi:hypothetical protein